MDSSDITELDKIHFPRIIGTAASDGCTLLPDGAESDEVWFERIRKLKKHREETKQETVNFCIHKRKFINNNFYAALEEMAQRTRDWMNSDEGGYIDSEVEAIYEANAFRLQHVIGHICGVCFPQEIKQNNEKENN
jgi:hypothetical protein